MSTELMYKSFLIVYRSIKRLALSLFVMMPMANVANAQIYFEAESADIGDFWDVFVDANASGDLALRPLVDDFQAIGGTEPIRELLSYTVTVPTAGTYEVWARFRADPAGGFNGSFPMSDDNATWTFYNMSTVGGAAFTWANLSTAPNFGNDPTFGPNCCDLFSGLVTTTVANETVTLFVSTGEIESILDKFALIPTVGSSGDPTGLGGAATVNLDFGDAPDTALDTNGLGDYSTLLGNTVPGPFHPFPATPEVYLGDTIPDSEADALQNAAADGDDAIDEGEAQLVSTAGGDAFPLLLSNASSYSIEIDATNDKAIDAYIKAWIDFDRNGTFDEDERADATLLGGIGDTQATLTWSSGAILTSLSAGDVYIRFRISTDAAWDTVAGTAAIEDTDSLDVVIDGETEDYLFTVFDVDFGDAPVVAADDYDDTDASGTVDTNDNPAAHYLSSTGVRFGSVDADNDTGVWGNGIDANGNATDDDTEGAAPDDEDGFTLPPLLSNDSSYIVTVTVNNGDATNDARVLAWIDLDQNGEFEEEELATLAAGTITPSGTYTIPPSASGTVQLNWLSLPEIASGPTYLRARISSDTSWLEGSDGGEDEASLGLVENGEVEDYALTIQGVDFGDAPIVANGYYDDTDSDGDVDSNDNAAAHVVVAGVRLGANDPDGEAGAFSDGIDSNANATDDDAEGATPDDEDAVATFSALLVEDSSYSLDVAANNSSASVATIAAWIDFDANGSFDQDERATATLGATSSATVTLTWASIPADIVVGTSYARIRISSDPTFSPSGSAADTLDSASLGQFNNGEVEDYQFQIFGSDYGDAPIVAAGYFDDTDSSGTINGADNPAFHGVTTLLRLGSNVPDVDTGRYGDNIDDNSNATDDDTLNDPLGNYDDENGLASLLPIPSSSTSYSLNFTATNNTGSSAELYAWIDFNRNGFWEESERQSATVVTGTNNGVQALTWTGLGGALPLGDAYMRVRFSTDSLDVILAEGAGITDDAALGRASDGEVEDYRLQIVASEDYGDVPHLTAGDYDDGAGAGFARHTLDPNLYLGSNAPDVDASAWGDGTDNNGNASDDDLKGLTPDDEDGVTVTNILTSNIGSTYSLALSAFNSTGAAANVYAWIDFDGSKTFDEDEIAATVTVPNTGANVVSLDWTVPPDTVVGTSYVRIRITTANLSAVSGGEDERSAGLAPDGEVEDFSILIQGQDFGDAPDSYATDLADGGEGIGPSHIIGPDLFLGSNAPDGDINGFVDGVDDSAGNAADDEVGGDEGISQLLSSLSDFPTLAATDATYSISINARNNTGANARIYAWIDFDQNGVFDEDELAGGAPSIIASSPSTQVRTIQWTSLPGLVAGATYIRLRITSDTPAAAGGGADERATGALSDGEVEDYVFTIGNTDYGDAPSPYKTLLVDDGPRHNISTDLFLGSVGADLDSDGFSEGTDANLNATDDDPSDENIADLVVGGAFTELRTSYASYGFDINYNNTTGGPTWIYAWIDFDQSGTFDVDEAVDGLFGAGASQTAILLWSAIPSDIVEGVTYARFRITTTPVTASGSGEDARSLGAFANGEVEDHQISIVPVDYGDAPNSYGTLVVDGGPSHIVSSNLYLGTVVADGDANGFGNGVSDTGNALDDDTEGTADEGITQLIGATSFPVLSDTDPSYTISGINVFNNTGSSANLYAWIDLNNNGSFADAGERAEVTVPTGGATTVNLTWSGIAAASTVSATYIRFRLRGDIDTSPLGLANDGEVEDYRIDISGTTTISGTVFEDINYGGGDGRNYLTSNSSFTPTDVATPATIQLWESVAGSCDGGTLLDTVNSVDGNYTFTGVAAPDDYCVRVVNSSVVSNRAGYVGSLLAVQTYRTESTDGIGSLTPIGTEVGGRFPAQADTAITVFDDSQTSSWSPVSTNGAAINDIDFGFNFNTVVNTNDSGQGSLRQFILNANALDNADINQVSQPALLDVSIFEIPVADTNYNLDGQQVFRITPLTALPTITDAAIVTADTQSGAACPAPKVELDGASTTGSGFTVAGTGGSSIRGFAINSWGTGITLTSDNNQVDCNYIGTNAAGHTADGNTVGIQINGNGNLIGASAVVRENVISGNTGIGINVAANSNIIRRNKIGIAADGLSRLDNGSHGISIDGSNNEVGSTTSTAVNTIAYNNGDGVRVIGGATSLDNEIRINAIYNNAGLAVDLGGNGVTANDGGDSDTGENGLLNRPVLSSVAVNANDLEITGTIDVAIGVYTVEFYANPVCNTDQSGLAQVDTVGESFQFLGSTSVVASTAGVQNLGTPTLVLTGVVPTLLGGSITAKVIEDSGDTSEFSDCFEAITPQTISGTVFEDVNYGGGAGRSFASSPVGAVGVAATVELWNSDGTNCTGSAPVQAVSTSGGSYSFSTAQPGAEYCVRVVNSSVQSSRSGWQAGIVPIQTFRTDFDADGAGLTNYTDLVGGASPRDVDSAAGVIDTAANDGVRTQSIAMVDLPPVGNVGAIDFGYNFSTIVNTNSSGQGSLPQFILNSNTLQGQTSLAQSGSRVPLSGSGVEGLPGGVETSIFMISNGGATAGLTSAYPNLLTGAGIAEIDFNSAQSLDTDNVSLDATTQSANVFGNNGVFYNSGVTVGQTIATQNPTMLAEVQIEGAQLDINADVQLRGFSFLPTTTAVTVTGGAGHIIEHNAFGVTGLFLADPGAGTVANAVEISGVTGGFLRSNVFGYGDQNGLLFGNGATGWTIDDNVFEGFALAGLLTQGQFSCVTAARNQFTLNQRGIDIQAGVSSSSCDFTESTINENTAEGVRVDIDTSAAITLVENIITENGDDGVSISNTSDNVLISRNNIFNNGALGIDLGNDGLSSNDGAADADSGANLTMNFPVITSVTANGTTATINGVLDSGQTGPFNVQLYSSAVCNGNTSGVDQLPPNGEGEKYHSEETGVTTGATFSINVNTADLAGPFITLLAYDANSNTSEFSACANSTFDDYGDAPDSYGTSNLVNGARHRTDNTIFIGAAVPDAEVDGFGGDGIDTATGTATDDDIDGIDDEDAGISFAVLTSALDAYTITVPSVTNTSGSAAELTAWIDFDRNGTFDTDEGASVIVPNGSTAVSFDLDWLDSPVGGQGTIPIDISEGLTYVRIRLTTDATVLTGDPSTSNPIGPAADGEVEDYALTINPGLDFGDAPDSYGTDLTNSGGEGVGPSHTRSIQLYMGSIAPDGEFDGIPAAAGAEADGDDINGINDDEDGADIGGLIPSDITFSIAVDIINLTGDDVTLHGWLDVNRDGDFADANEYTSTSLSGATGSINDVGLTWSGFTQPAVTGAEPTYIRTRLARTSEGITSADFGGFFGEGEVEDYRLIVSELNCNTLYVQNYETSINGGLRTRMRIYNEGASGDNLTDVFTTSVGSNGVALDPITRRYYWKNSDNNADSSIFYNDGSGEVDTGVNITPGDNYNRSAFNPSGQLFFVDGDLSVGGTQGIRAYNVTGTTLTSIAFADNTIADHPDNTNVAINPNGRDVTTTNGGDIAFDLDGNMYLLSYDGNTPTQFFIYRIVDLFTNPTAIFLRAQDVPATVPFDNQRQTAGAAFANDDTLYMFSVGGRVFSWDLSANTLVTRPPFGPEDMTLTGNVFGSPDAASCIFPLLRPSLIVEKEVFNLTTPAAPGFVPGDNLLYRITIENVGAFFSDTTTFTDTIPANSTYVLGTTTLNGNPIADLGVQMPYQTGASINSPSGGVGIIEAGETAVIEFQVMTDISTAYTEVCNDTGIVEFTDVAAISTSSGATINQATDDPSTTAVPVFPAVGGVSSDPTCLDKTSGFAVSGTVFEDINVDGIDDGSVAGENGISGVEMVLRNNTDGICESTFTDANGDYSFGPLVGGSYTIYEADGELIPTPSNCPPIENDPPGYLSSTVGSLTVNVTNADIGGQDFGDVQQPLFSPNNSGIVQPGNSLVYAHTFTPRANGSVGFSFSETTVPAVTGWSVTLYQDNDCDNLLSGPDSLITSSIAATAGVDVCILARVTAPSTVASGNQHSLDIDANFDYAGAFVPNSTLTVIDTTTVVSADDGSLLLVKTVENITPSSPYFDSGTEQVSNEGEPGDVLLYRIKFQNVGSTPVTNVDVFDATPSFTQLETPIALNCVDGRETVITPQIPAGLTCTRLLPSAGDNVSGYSGSIQWQLIGTLLPGEQGVVLFSVEIE